MPPPQGTWNPIEGPADYTMTKLVHNDSYPAIDPVKADLSGKAVFVSGASRGIGRSIAVSYAKAGASYLAISARGDLSTTVSEIKTCVQEAGKPLPKILELKIDITNKESVEEGVKKINQGFGRLDIVINNAGFAALGGPKIMESDPDTWWMNFSVNVLGAYLITRSTLPLLLKSPSNLKTIISIASVGALCTSPTLSGYQTSKLGVVRFSEFIATEYAQEGIIAISIHPGNVFTDIVNNGEGMKEELKPVFTESKRLCGDVLVYLSKERREWLSGRYVNVTWDMEEFCSEEKRKGIEEGDKLKVRLVVE